MSEAEPPLQSPRVEGMAWGGQVVPRASQAPGLQPQTDRVLIPSSPEQGLLRVLFTDEETEAQGLRVR